jgi:hypothetical protein
VHHGRKIYPLSPVKPSWHYGLRRCACGSQVLSDGLDAPVAEGKLRMCEDLGVVVVTRDGAAYYIWF